MGSTKTLTDATGNATGSYTYDAFGTVENQTGIASNPYRYAGEYFDEQINLQYNRARWYDAGVGRFVSQDTYHGASARPITLNKYAYANDDPANIADPSGLFGLGEIGVANSIASILSNIQIDIGTNLLDAALNPEAGSSSGTLLLGLAAMGPAGFQVLKKLSSKFRKLNLPVANKIDMDHITGVHMSGPGKVTGYYLRPGGVDLSGWVVKVTKGPNNKGVYEGLVFYNGKEKKGHTGRSTFFPDQWDEQRTANEIMSAYMNSKGAHLGAEFRLPA